MAGYVWSDEREEPATKNTLTSKTLIQIWWRNQKLSRPAKVKRIYHNQTRFTTKTKVTSLGKKHKRRKTITQKKFKKIKKMVKGSYILISLNASGLNVLTKRQNGWAYENMCMHALPLTTSVYIRP